MSAESRTAITAAQAENIGIYVSPITAWEIAALAAKDRLQLTLSPEAWFDYLLRLPVCGSLRCRPKC
jgi:PIN domain nuclease of toxin-antitoxin system